MGSGPMQYSRLVRDAWDLTWRHRFLWIFAFFGGAQGGGGCGADYQQAFSGGGSDGTGLPGGQEVERLADQAAGWVSEHLGTILAVGLALSLLFLALLIVSFVARGALISSTARVA